MFVVGVSRWSASDGLFTDRPLSTFDRRLPLSIIECATATSASSNDGSAPTFLPALGGLGPGWTARISGALEPSGTLASSSWSGRRGIPMDVHEPAVGDKTGARFPVGGGWHLEPAVRDREPRSGAPATSTSRAVARRLFYRCGSGIVDPSRGRMKGVEHAVACHQVRALPRR